VIAAAISGGSVDRGSLIAALDNDNADAPLVCWSFTYHDGGSLVLAGNRANLPHNPENIGFW